MPADLDVHRDATRVTVHSASVAGVLSNVARLAEATAGPATSVEVRRPTLDDVFLQLTGDEVERPAGAARADDRVEVAA
jgi:hypothetical protein